MKRTIRDQGPWDKLRASFTWQIPRDFSIARTCCDGWAAREPDRPAIHHVGDGDVQTWTYGQLKDASDRLASAFRAQGVSKGDCVGILLPQCPEVMIAHFAAMKIGAIALPLFTLFGEDALAYRIGDAMARAVVTDSNSLDKVVAVSDGLDSTFATFCLGGGPDPVLNLWDAIKAARPIDAPDPGGAETPAILIYTSGTTGAPKGALHGHRFLPGHLPAIELQHEFFPKPDAVGWTPADWAWIGGLMDLAMPCLYFGVPLVSHRMRKFDPEAAFRLIADHRVTNMFLPPTALRLMRGAPVPDGLDIRAIGSGGESLGADLHDWVKTRLGGHLNELYGQTECNLVISTCHSAMEVRPGTMGRAVPGHEVAVLGEDGLPAPSGTAGEIAIKRPDPVMFLEYWKNSEATAKKFSGDWLLTGDLGTCDEDGYFTYLSRDDDVINSAGYRIGPTEIENCLTGHPDVVQAAAVGVPDDIRGEIVKAFVVMRDGAPEGLEDALRKRVADRVSPHVAPRVIERVDSLPVTATGKVIRKTLREKG